MRNLRMFLTIAQLIKVLLFTRYLVSFFPFYALLVRDGVVTGVCSLLVILPFISAMSLGFAYNASKDYYQDPPDKNPIVRGEISLKAVRVLVSLLFLVSILLSIFVFKSVLGLLVYFAYLHLWLAYSGLRLRFKETLIGPAIASIVLWTGGPLILLLEFNYMNVTTILLLLGIYFIFLSYEIDHTIIDYESDLKSNCRTFAIRVGRRYASYAKYITVCFGYGLTLLSICDILTRVMRTLFVILFVALFILSFVLDEIALPGSYVSYCNYFVAKLLIVTFGALSLDLPAIIVAFMVWLFLSRVD